MSNSRKWKNNDDEYLFYLQNFLDIADNIIDKDLKKRVINSMLVCDRRLTELAEKKLKNE